MLSIIIPTYNEEDFLPALLKSLENQTYRDFEVIVADAKSTDQTREIAVAYGCQVVEGGPTGMGWNHGPAPASGESLLFLDGDVILPAESFLSNVLRKVRGRRLEVATCRIDPVTD